ncbi:alpha/beta-hydrolase [Penicillium macrosclerotiorum]|uniref:alpha/beta-hydrolase n=1 Tax=Penicillium macrosclerotiorum TaxID=303699 RepID=UPI002546ACF8|nr:alpha/beta-hydrolase [Penicillium macrosclerotiorum]KAJ5689874.1 alpha/beta-hydrolase [Penicillium macrosclerotiorum]
MSFQAPISKVTTNVSGLGVLEGFHYANGVEQFCGIPYATLAQRWTRSVLKSSWDDNYHDGTLLGNNMPRPQVPGQDVPNIFIPVPQNPYFPNKPKADEKTALVMNIVVPIHPGLSTEKLPVLAWIHGGSLLFGSANYGIYDAVNLVSHSLNIEQPVIVVNFNYRLGLGGFLASNKIGRELKRNGFQGNGNFGFTDQKVAMDWIQKYILQFGGDPNNVTVFGQSAGAISIGHHMSAADPMKFQRAICMSGLGSTLAPLNLEQHEKIFEATCRYFSIDPYDHNALDLLRKVPEQDMANADPIIQDVASGTGNPCDDGWFYASEPQLQAKSELPNWLESLLIGDVHDEGVIFILNLENSTYETIRETLLRHVNQVFVDNVLKEYNITPGISKTELIARVSNMGADAVFRIPNWETANANKRLLEKNALFKYHFDQRSRFENILKDKAYHGLDVLYLFGNLKNKLYIQEREMGQDMATDWIKFAWGQEPWEVRPWKIWGPDSLERLETEEQDESVRFYSRFKRLLEWSSGGIWEKYIDGLGEVLMKRGAVKSLRYKDLE